MTEIKNFAVKYKWPLIIGGLIILIAGAYFIGRNHTTVADREAQPVQIPQELLNNFNALQNKLDISEQNAKELAAEIAKIRSGQVQPVANYYVTAPTVEKAADTVQQQIKENDPTLPPAALEKTDRTVVTPITKDSTGNTLPPEQQKVDIYKIDFDRHWEIGGGGGAMNGKAVAVAAVQYNTKEVSYELIGNKENVIGLVKKRF
ncbi:MAG: glycoprotease [Sporomusaceae bacterium]|nr:glycoprotease [Sporomusaceae bacterium]